MKAVVIGANGQLGRALLDSVPQGWTATGTDRGRLDLTEPEAVEAFLLDEAPDAILNAAAYTAVDRAEDEEALALAVNATAVSAMARAAAQLGCRFVHVSTDFVFDGGSSRAYGPGAATAPLSAYGRTKLAGEQAAGPDAAIVRTSWVYSAGSHNFVRTMLRVMRERDEVRVVADQIGAPTWAPGLAATIWALLGHGAKGLFHHRDAGVASWYDFAVAIQEEALAIGLLDREVPVRPVTTADYPTRAVRPAFSLLDDSATRALLGDQPPHWRVNLRTMLKEELRIG
ncbi:dTDP-4-dehydrorhamnose reductase [Novosphingobium mangrovi (ex Huang et al. 2023)]|uniref:dTDP-4-dehydrorhamnose reductase n=1 Tax=Novosphingobium mangrovi (ex Huang et al. 2023) TaxID=2976432 RepID=A0ABT2I0S1_9SPHN|nr:dTDP-4-dehydrorhamnose reductase [Novosphingobium mangrovi (ex Huang et al. 2023)]MCT2398401.1 dTDP-4-dehydrorhamnose reductase [Novosphingobium mangrovi (ex Huang et al. 2023)]